MSIFKALKGVFDCSLLVGGDSCAKFFKLLLSLEDYGICLVQLVDTLLFSLVGSCIGGSLVFHTLDFGIGQTG